MLLLWARLCLRRTPGKECYCRRCSVSRAVNRVRMRVEKGHGWRVSFRDAEHSGVQFKKFTFADHSKIEELIGRTSKNVQLEDRQAFE